MVGRLYLSNRLTKRREPLFPVADRGIECRIRSPARVEAFPLGGAERAKDVFDDVGIFFGIAHCERQALS